MTVFVALQIFETQTGIAIVLYICDTGSLTLQPHSVSSWPTTTSLTSQRVNMNFLRLKV